jgi:hypothetical protein
LFLLCRAIRALSNYFVYQAKLYVAAFFQSVIRRLHHAGSLTLHRSMVGTEAPKSIYEGDDDDDDEEEVDRTSFLQPKRPTAVPGTKPLLSFIHSFILPTVVCLLRRLLMMAVVVTMMMNLCL